jgi:hypothetical protein
MKLIDCHRQVTMFRTRHPFHKTHLVKHCNKHNISLKCLHEYHIAAVSKIVSNTFTYPIETVRLWSLQQRKYEFPRDIKKLYIGFNQFVPYNLINNVITYNIYYKCMEILMFVQYEYALLISCFVTCVITLLYKIPFSYWQKNRLMGGAPDFKKFQNIQYVFKTYTVSMLEDVLELYIKFYLNHFIHTSIPPLCRALIVGVFTSLLISPIEFTKTQILCESEKLVFTHKSILIKMVSTMLNTFVFFFTLNSLMRVLL